MSADVEPVCSTSVGSWPGTDLPDALACRSAAGLDRPEQDALALVRDTDWRMIVAERDVTTMLAAATAAVLYLLLLCCFAYCAIRAARATRRRARGCSPTPGGRAA